MVYTKEMNTIKSLQRENYHS